MFSWLLTKLKTWLTRDERYDTYHPGERMIYRYWDGQKFVTDDPMVLWSKIQAVSTDLSVEMSVANSPSKSAEAEKAKMLNRIRGIFSVKPLSQGGLTESETVDLLDHFLTYCGRVKKNSSTSSMPPEEPLSGISNSPDDGPPTPNTSGSGSTATEPYSEPPTPPPSESVSPSAA